MYYTVFICIGGVGSGGTGGCVLTGGFGFDASGVGASESFMA